MMGGSERQLLLALDCARVELACVVVRVVVRDGGVFVVLHCLSSDFFLTKHDFLNMSQKSCLFLPPNCL